MPEAVSTTKNAKQLMALEFLRQHDGEIFLLDGFATTCNWKTKTPKTQSFTIETL